MRLRIICALSVALGVSGCQTVPDHEVAQLVVEDGVVERARAGRISDPERVYWKPVTEMNNYICRSPRDEQRLIEWYRRTCKGGSK